MPKDSPLAAPLMHPYRVPTCSASCQRQGQQPCRCSRQPQLAGNCVQVQGQALPWLPLALLLVLGCAGWRLASLLLLLLLLLQQLQCLPHPLLLPRRPTHRHQLSDGRQMLELVAAHKQCTACSLLLRAVACAACKRTPLGIVPILPFRCGPWPRLTPPLLRGFRPLRRRCCCCCCCCRCSFLRVLYICRRSCAVLLTHGVAAGYYLLSRPWRLIGCPS